MSSSLGTATRLKPEVRLAQAISLFEADLPDQQKVAFRSAKAQACETPPSSQDVLRLIAEIDQRALVFKRRCFGARMMNVLEAVQQFAALGDIIVGGSQNIIACGIWTVVRSSLLIITKYSSYLERLSTLFMIAGRSAPRYEKMALLYPRSKNLQSYMCDYFITLVQICHKMLKFTLKSTFGQLTAVLNEGDLHSFQLSLERWAANIKEEITLLIAERIEDESLKTSKFQNALWKKISKSEDDSHQARINARLQVLNFCSEFDHAVVWKQTRKAGTTIMFRESPEYTTWKDPALACISCTLIYMGKLGSGKSVLLANMVDDLHLHSQGITVAYFFCRHDLNKSLQARTIIGSLVRQVMNNIQDFAAVLDLLNQYTGHHYDDFEKMSSLLECAFPSGSRALNCFIVVDGLDDLNESERAKTIWELFKLQEKFKIRLCVSFREDPTTHDGGTSYLDDFLSTTVMPIPDNSSEIRTFILEELESRLESQQLVVGDPTLILEIREALFNGCQGMFLWAALQIETLCTMKTDFELRRALKDFPRDLAETFSRVMQRFDWKEDSQQRAILNLIIASQRPLTIFEMQEALSVIPGEIHWDPSRSLNSIHATLATCGCLINIDEEELTARLVHPSLRQFLLNTSPQTMTSATNFTLTLDAAHRFMAEIIVTYLSYNVFEKQLSRTVIPRINASSATSTILQSTLSSTSSASIRNLAIKLLKVKSEPDYDLGKALAQVNPLCREHSAPEFRFYIYATSFWHTHVIGTAHHNESTISLLAKLVQSKAIDANCLDGDDLTPLMRATAAGNETVVRFLLGFKDVDVNMKSASGHTALHLALLNQNSEGPLALFDSPELDIHCKDQQGRSILHLAAEQGDAVTFEKLATERQLDVNCINYHGETALHIAVQRGVLEIVILLLTLEKVDVNAQDADGNTPLHIAIQREQVDIVEQLLICERVKIEMANYHGRSPLSMVISLGDEDMGNLFLQCSRLDGNYKDRLREVLVSPGPNMYMQYRKEWDI
ncbi:hypothetical protein N7478_005145 [Penicillium angulare]|uniref:uncharacterized protein n=1 Tax=Penicillium angulare TaxID=116970 RepID=UPI002540C08C|nr:uncharacterized protein N7478_005145 [Penicillium angulare]KAJ5279773.1 hypothetical protein N7478_005145 [Penicillium angulare]